MTNFLIACSPIMNVNELKTSAIAFLEGLRISEFEFRFSKNNESSLIASSLAVMLGALTGWLDRLSDCEKRGWADYINRYQLPSGFFSDDDIGDNNRVPGYTQERALFHRTRHALFALSTLGHRPKYEFHFLSLYRSSQAISEWMNHLTLSDYWDASNKIMDLSLFLDFEARICDRSEAVKAIQTLLDICDSNTNPKTGYHDRGESELRNAMAGAMHLYPIYFMWKRKPLFPERVIDTTLSLQQTDGLFGYEVGTGGEDCLDYDAVNILVNFSFVTNYNREAIQQSLRRVITGVLECQNEDGGFACHRRQEPYRFGTFTTEVSMGGSSLWSTYSRLITLAMASYVFEQENWKTWNLGYNLMEIWDGGTDRMKNNGYYYDKMKERAL